MEQRDFAQVVLAVCAELLGEGDLTLDETGYCALVSEREDVLHIKLDGAQNALIFMAALSDNELDADNAFLLAGLLRANFFWERTGGATLAMEPDGNALLIEQPFFLEGSTGRELHDFVLRFADLLEIWRREYNELKEQSLEESQPFVVTEY